MNFYETARSNYFAVKDSAAFQYELERVPGIMAKEQDGLWCLLMDEGVPAWIESEDGDPFSEDGSFDLQEFLAGHLVDGHVAVVMASGYEGMRYVSGYAFAVNSIGEARWVSLSDIYALAEELRSDTNDAPGVTQASY